MQKTFTFEFEATKRPGWITSGRGITPTVWAGLSHRIGVQSRFPSHTLTWPTHNHSITNNRDTNHSQTFTYDALNCVVTKYQYMDVFFQHELSVPGPTPKQQQSICAIRLGRSHRRFQNQLHRQPGPSRLLFFRWAFQRACRFALERRVTRLASILSTATVLFSFCTRTTGRRSKIRPDRSLASTAVGEMCTEETATLSPSDSVAEAIRVMRRHAVRRLPVVEDGRPVGVVSIGDLVLRPEVVPASELRSAFIDIMAAPPDDPSTESHPNVTAALSGWAGLSYFNIPILKDHIVWATAGMLLLKPDDKAGIQLLQSLLVFQEGQRR